MPVCSSFMIYQWRRKANSKNGLVSADKKSSTTNQCHGVRLRVCITVSHMKNHKPWKLNVIVFYLPLMGRTYHVSPFCSNIILMKHHEWTFFDLAVFGAADFFFISISLFHNENVESKWWKESNKPPSWPTKRVHNAVPVDVDGMEHNMQFHSGARAECQQWQRRKTPTNAHSQTNNRTLNRRIPASMLQFPITIVTPRAKKIRNAK